MSLFDNVKENFFRIDNCGYPLNNFEGAISKTDNLFIWVKNQLIYDILKKNDIIQRVNTLEKYIVISKSKESSPLNPKLWFIYIKPYNNENIDNDNKSYWKVVSGDIVCSNCEFSCNDEWYLGKALFCPECGKDMTKFGVDSNGNAIQTDKNGKPI